MPVCDTYLLLTQAPCLISRLEIISNFKLCCILRFDDPFNFIGLNINLNVNLINLLIKSSPYHGGEVCVPE